MGSKLEDQVVSDLNRRGFSIRHRNFWLGRRVEVDIWAVHPDWGDIWIEVKSQPAEGFETQRWRAPQKQKLLKAAEFQDVSVWLAMVSREPRTIYYVDATTLEAVAY